MLNQMFLVIAEVEKKILITNDMLGFAVIKTLDLSSLNLKGDKY
jgi:hypothetical protein